MKFTINHKRFGRGTNRALFCVLVVHGALDLAGPLHVERRHVVQQVRQQRAHNLHPTPRASAVSAVLVACQQCS